MKVTKSRIGDYWVVYYYVPQPEGRPRKIIRKFKVGTKGAEGKASRLKRKWEKELQEVGTSNILPAKIMQEVKAAKGELADYPGISLIDVARFYKKHHFPRARPLTIAEAVTEYIASEKKRGIRDKTLSQYTGRTGEFSKKFGHILVTEIRGVDIIRWITNLGRTPITQWGYLGCIERVFSHCIAEQVIRKSPISDADIKLMPAKKRSTAPTILTGEQGQALFKAFPKEEKAMFAVLYFTGMRRTVGQRLTWKDVDRKNKVIHVPESADKVGVERFIEGMPDRLWEILDTLPKKKPDEPLVVSDRRFKTLMSKATKGAKIKDWPKNAIRRSFASHHLNYKNPKGGKDRLSETLLIMCHTGKPTVFWDFYYRRSNPEEAATYFDVGFNI